MKELKKAFPVTIPVLAGYIFLGITYGILMVTNGFPIWLPVLTAAVIYTGSMEFLMVEILSSSFAPLSAFLTAIMVGARHLFYGLSMLKNPIESPNSYALSSPSVFFTSPLSFAPCTSTICISSF